MSNESHAKGAASAGKDPTEDTRRSSQGRESGTTGGVQSVDRAVRVLKILAAGDAGVTEVAEQLGVHKSTAFRLLAALEEHDLVRQAQARGHYALGFGIQRLASSVSGQIDLVREARSPMEDLAEALGETVNIAVLRETYAVNMSQAISRSAVAAHNWTGELTPRHATASGKMLLAALREQDRGPYLHDLEAYTPQTLTDPQVLAKQLREIAARGWAETHDELEIGLHAVAVPVRDHTDTVVAALSVSGPTYRFGEDRFPEILSQTIEAAQVVSTRLGHFGG
ncbi:IclR family transcriptional regulator [Leekyejoonella antrihumi]|uniref:Glycerol operon regulatory protein n=1 Tax=Leekyejoonella antrihumi TaxID=1660198 RepID=A0A563DZ38_9MICO|nr:IclR family transcriptional regulator [Leekyejoonella antrihumi]TWP35486.1 IclR family transcriptional regulator [Leekyejoonella antrihumi]